MAGGHHRRAYHQGAHEPPRLREDAGLAYVDKRTIEW